jgi:hypothetical protein
MLFVALVLQSTRISAELGKVDPVRASIRLSRVAFPFRLAQSGRDFFRVFFDEQPRDQASQDVSHEIVP